jgi:hypothetical protein
MGRLNGILGSGVRRGTALRPIKSFLREYEPSVITDPIRNYGGGVMIALGDSYTTMGAAYFSAFASAHGLVCDNRGVASSTIAGSSINKIGFQPFHERLDSIITQYQAGHRITGTTYTAADVKLVIFMGGANDWSTVNKEVDRLGKGPQETNREKLYGALNYIFSTLLSTFVKADIVVILQPMYPTATVPIFEDAAKNAGFENLEQASKISDVQFACYQMARKERIILEMAQQYGLSVCDCCFDWHNPVNPTDREKYWISDGHLSRAGNTDLISALEFTVNNLRFSRSR